MQVGGPADRWLNYCRGVGLGCGVGRGLGPGVGLVGRRTINGLNEFTVAQIVCVAKSLDEVTSTSPVPSLWKILAAAKVAGLSSESTKQIWIGGP